jgi:hypothetical protein
MSPPAALSSTVFVVASIAWITGAGNSYLTAVIFQTDCDSACSAQALGFNKPIFLTLVAFVGMSLSVLPWWRENRKHRGAEQAPQDTLHLDSERTRLLDLPHFDASSMPLDAGRHSTYPSSLCAAFAKYVPLVTPTVLDVTATGLQTAAVVFIPAGVTAALRGALLLCTGLSNRLLGVKDSRAGKQEWISMIISSVGAGMVGAAVFLETPAASSSPEGLSAFAASCIGVALAVSSVILAAFQISYETKFLEGKHYSTNEVNAVEGIFGSPLLGLLMVTAQFIPASRNDGRVVEDSNETFCCLRRTPVLSGMCVALLLLYALSTQVHMKLSSLAGANFRSFVLISRCAVIWVLELIVYAAAGRYGEPWSRASWLQLAGVLIIICGGILQWRGKQKRELGS